MPIPEVAQGIVLDARRLLAFKFETPVNVLVFYGEDGVELDRVDHFWSMDRPRGSRSKNADQFGITLVEDGTELDDTMAAVRSVRYQVETLPTATLSDHYDVKVANRPEPGRNRAWTLNATKAKFKSKYFGASGLNR